MKKSELYALVEHSFSLLNLTSFKNISNIFSSLTFDFLSTFISFSNSFLTCCCCIFTCCGCGGLTCFFTCCGCGGLTCFFTCCIFTCCCGCLTLLLVTTTLFFGLSINKSKASYKSCKLYMSNLNKLSAFFNFGSLFFSLFTKPL